MMEKAPDLDAGSPAYAAGVEIDISVDGAGWDQAPFSAEALARRAALAVLSSAAADIGPCELSIVLSDDETVRDLNRTWRGKDSPTNVLAFPAGAARVVGQPALLGDVIVAFGVASDEAGDGSLSDHIAHLVVHGTLHLLGYDHQDDDEAEEMETLETRILAGMGVDDPYADHG
jgi:probable rRNA maturation factor